MHGTLRMLMACGRHTRMHSCVRACMHANPLNALPDDGPSPMGSRPSLASPRHILHLASRMIRKVPDCGAAHVKGGTGVLAPYGIYMCACHVMSPRPRCTPKHERSAAQACGAGCSQGARSRCKGPPCIQPCTQPCPPN